MRIAKFEEKNLLQILHMQIKKIIAFRLPHDNTTHV